MKRFVFIILLACSGFIANAQKIDSLLATLSSNSKKVDTLRYWGRKFLLMAKPDSADYCVRKALAIAKNEPANHSRIVQLYTDLSRIYTLRRKPEFALEELKRAKEYITPQTKQSTVERYYFFSGYVYRLLNITDSAIYFYRKAELVNNIDNPYRNWEVFQSVGQLFYYNGNLDKAEDYYLKAYTITSGKKIKMDHGIVLNSLGAVYYDLHKPEKYAAIQQEFSELLELEKKDFTKDPVHSMLYSSWRKNPKAEQIAFLTEVKNIHLKNKFYQGAALANMHMADIYSKENEVEKALALLLENRDHLIEKGNYYVYYNNLNRVYELQVAAGKNTEALATASQLFQLNKKLTDITNRELTLGLEKKYETEKKEKEIELLNSKSKLADIEIVRQSEIRQALERENILKDATISQQEKLANMAAREKEFQVKELDKERQLSSSLIRENKLNQALLNDDKMRNQLLWSGIILLAMAAGIILIQYRRQIIKNRIIEKQREDLEVLNREIHHRVKNNLQVISSLLDLQSAASQDSLTAEKFQEGSQRVQSMAFIHQNLYQGERIGSIDMRQYITMLTNNLMQSYHATNGNITLHTDVEAISLHSDTVIPLGMIINELVSNSLKYAFQHKESGHIDITLKKNNEQLHLLVKDNGIGFTVNADVTEGPSFGYKIIKAFSQKLKALMTIENNNGTTVQFVISKYRTT